MTKPVVDITQSHDFFKRIKNGDEEAFRLVFDLYYKHLVLLAMRFVNDRDWAESVVQSVFVKLWEKRESLKIESVKAYLIVSVRNYCQNELKHQKVVRIYESKFVPNEAAEDVDFPDAEVMDKINSVIEELPEQRKKIFKMNRIDGMRYKEIADTLGISPKTVEVQIGKALKFLRENLQSLKNRVYYHN